MERIVTPITGAINTPLSKFTSLSDNSQPISIEKDGVSNVPFVPYKGKVIPIEKNMPDGTEYSVGAIKISKEKNMWLFMPLLAQMLNNIQEQLVFLITRQVPTLGMNGSSSTTTYSSEIMIQNKNELDLINNKIDNLGREIVEIKSMCQSMFTHFNHLKQMI